MADALQIPRGVALVQEIFHNNLKELWSLQLYDEELVGNWCKVSELQLFGIEQEEQRLHQHSPHFFVLDFPHCQSVHQREHFLFIHYSCAFSILDSLAQIPVEGNLKQVHKCLLALEGALFVGGAAND